MTPHTPRQDRQSTAASLREAVLRRLMPLVRAVIRHGPSTAARFMNEHVVRYYFAWRPIPLDFWMGNGLRIRGDIRDVIVRRLYFEDAWERPLMGLLAARLRPGDVFVDVGANFGFFSLLASRLVGPEGAVVAIEASPSTYERLLDHVRMNGADNVACVNVAASDHQGRLKVFSPGVWNSGGTTTVEDPQELAARAAVFETEIEAKPLSRIVPDHLYGRIRLIKIDVEGAEAAVLRGLEPMLGALPEDVTVVVELNPEILGRSGIDLAAPLVPFLSAGFRMFHVPDEDGDIVPVHTLDRTLFIRFGTANIALARDLT